MRGPVSARAILLGAAAGLVGGLAMTLLMLGLRAVLGVPTTAELVGDRIAALLPLDFFLSLLSFFGGYNHLKQLGAGATLAGQLAAAVAGGALLGYLAERAWKSSAPGEAAPRLGIARGPLKIVAALAVGAWLLLLAALWPNLDTEYAGLPPGGAMAVTIVALAVDLAAYVAVTIGAYRLLKASDTGPSGEMAAPFGGATRRRVLTGGIGLGLAVISGGLLKRLFEMATFSYDGTQYSGPDLKPITPNDRFYQVTKNLIDPQVSAAVWRLEVSGHVDRPATYDLAAIQAIAPIQQETTLMCISNPIDWGLMSNAVWTGIPMRMLLEAAHPRPGAVEVLCHAADGYTDSFAFDKAMERTTLVAYRMNGETLPQRHGFPARLIVPGMFGEKNVKWVTRIEVVDQPAKGFYEQQGWGPNFEVPNRSRIDGPDLSQAIPLGRSVQLHGVAFGGDRGVSKVEVTTDNQRTWKPGSLTYPGTALTWAFWSYTWQPKRAGDYKLAVRMTDGEGRLQTAERRGTAPQGATGYDTANVSVDS